ncbi:rapid alkalinization factor-like [Ananas comosus]|uniref:Rapid alkalinization factor-like n=2 Tax=Ananas comosus TaxID=4615 RepID=A0A6P5GFF7_ANACO|nr:rapid alkalinization factor-like [Ananas comosus]CAD1830323.1 unnamed protein product [Ananas comosus var. bracteatus]
MPLQRVFLVSFSLILSTYLVCITGTEAKTSNMRGYNDSSSRIGDRELEAEFLMDTEAHRRFLEQGKNIDYGALNSDRPACNAGAGKPYSGNCVPASSGNKHGRGCEIYDHCRSGHR